MKQFDTRPYSVNDFLEWNDRDQLELSPKFQRRNVWTSKAKSYLMDSIIRGKPFPKILLREHLSAATRKTLREVVDGQQRLRTIFEFVDDTFTISRIHNRKYAGVYFSQLPPDVQQSFLSYQIATDCLSNISDSEVRDIFARLNTFGVKLNAMELINAQRVGDFKASAFRLGNEFGTFWLENKIFTDRQIARMKDAEMAADLLITLGDGIQDKGRLDSYFKDWDNHFPKRATHEQQFRHVMDTIGSIFDGAIADYPFKRPVLFYSLFGAVAHMQIGLPRLSVVRAKIPRARFGRIRNSLAKVERIWREDFHNQREEEFYVAAKRATTHQPEREMRAKFLCQLIRRALG